MFGGEGLVRQGQRAVTVSHGQALLLDCRTPQSYGTSPKRNHWHHLWAHIQGTGVNAAAHRLGLPDLIPISVSTSRIRPHFDTIFERLRGEDVESTELVGMAVHALLSELSRCRAVRMLAKETFELLTTYLVVSKLERAYVSVPLPP